MKSAHLKSTVETAALGIPVKKYTYRVWLSVLFLILIVYGSFWGGFLKGIFILCLLDLLFCADVALRNSWRDLEKGRFSVSVLVSVSLLAGCGYGLSKTFLADPLAGNLPDIYIAMAVLLSVYLWSCGRNARGKERTQVFIKKLDDFLPKSGRLLIGMRERMVFASELKEGDIIRVKAGERIPCEGIIARGETTIDESLITGNMMPTSKKQGGKVYAGTLNKGAHILVRVEKNVTSSVIAGIINAIKNSERRRCIRQDVLDKYAPWIFVWSVCLAIAGYVYFYWAGHYTRPLHNLGILLLLMGLGCPWGFLFAAMVPMGSLHLGAKRKKIDIHAMGALEVLDHADMVFFDKTGTLTYGELRISSVHTGNETARRRLLTCLATAEQLVDGPFANAVMLYAQEQNIQPKSLRCFDVVPGMGVSAISGKDTIVAGRPEWLREQGIDITVGPHERQAVICGAKNGKAIGYVLLDDKLRSGAAEMIRSLRLGGKEVVLMSGDNEDSVRAVAEEIGIEQYNSGVLPQTKAEILGNYVTLGKKTVMVGDGFNDIIALLRSDAGIVFSSGKNVYNNWVDVVIRRGDLRSITDLFGLHRRLTACIRGNVILGMLCNMILMAAVLFGPSSWWQERWSLLAGLSVGVIFVFFNSMRLLHIK